MNNLSLSALGGLGSYSEEAAMNYLKTNGLPLEIRLCGSIEECFDVVENGQSKISIVPILNSTTEASWINTTLAGLRNRENIVISGEEILPISLNLAVLPGTRKEDLAYVHSKDKALQQASRYLRTELPKAALIPEGSTSAAAEKVRKMQEKDHACIVNLRAAEINGLEIIASNIQDNKNNRTRFIVIGREDSPPTGKDKTTILYEFKEASKPGVLHEISGEFARRGISICYIQSIPKEGKLEEFTFYMEVLGHRRDPALEEALKALKSNKELEFYKLLGSYPIHKKIK